MTAQEIMKNSDRNEEIATIGHKDVDQQKQNVTQTMYYSSKKFTVQESLLTNLFNENDHIKTIYDITFLFLHLMLFYKIGIHHQNDTLDQEIDIIKSGFDDFPYIIGRWLKYHVDLLLIYLPLNILRLKLLQKYSQTSYSRHILSYLMTYLILIDFWLDLNKFHNIKIGYVCTIILIIERIRLYLKLYSYVTETEAVDRHVTNTMNIADTYKREAKRLTYFLFAPTLVYREEYPRATATNWIKVFINMYEFNASLAIGCFCTKPFYQDVVFGPFNREPWQVFSYLPVLTIGIASGMLFFLQFFYAFYHNWHNVWAEVTRFGDRDFYGDFWNGRETRDYNVKWNFIVQDWLYYYVYLPVRRRTSNRDLASDVVNYMSHITHSIIYSVLSKHRMYIYMLILCPSVAVLRWWRTPREATHTDKYGKPKTLATKQRRGRRSGDLLDDIWAEVVDVWESCSRCYFTGVFGIMFVYVMSIGYQQQL